MPSTITAVAEQSEPTLRDVLNAVNGLGIRMDRLEAKVDGLEKRMDVFETRMDRLEIKVVGLDTRVGGLEAKMDELNTSFHELALEAPRHITSENGLIRRDIAAFRRDVDARFDKVDDQVAEIRSDVRRLDWKLDQHIHDREIHLPRVHAIGDAEAGPVAA